MLSCMSALKIPERGPAPYGYRKDYQAGKPATNYIVEDKSEQAVIKLMLGLQAEGMSLRKITDELNRAGSKPRNGDHWVHQNVDKILRREKADKLVDSPPVHSSKPVDKCPHCGGAL